MQNFFFLWSENFNLFGWQNVQRPHNDNKNYNKNQYQILLQVGRKGEEIHH